MNATRPFQTRWRPSRRLHTTMLLAVAGLVASAGARGAADAQTCAVFDHEHVAWADVLREHVRNGSIDYAGLNRSGAALDRSLAALESVCTSDVLRWTREQQLAFWINAYNAYTVKLIVQHHPLKSIRSIGLLPGAAFRERFIPLGSLRSGSPRRRMLSLSDIEHEILRKNFREPRIHFAIVCASKSCPELRDEPYRAATLDAQLTQAAHRFLGDPAKNNFDATTNTLKLSPIFRWFRGDFEGAAGTIPAFVAPFAEPSFAAVATSPDVRVAFLDYDWSLNGS